MPLPRPFRRRASQPPAVPAPVPPPVLRTPRAAAGWITLAVLLVGGAVGGTMWWLLTDLAAQAPTAPAGQPAARAGSALGEVLRTALAAGAGVGAGITLALAFRRQRQLELHNAVTTLHADRVATMTEHDATERRVTDLYTKAAEQLGHDKAAVRLAGLYALERLAQDNPAHRQTIVNVICAYLRMPYTPPTPPGPEQSSREALRRAVETALVVVPTTDTTSASGADQEGERQVRLTAQTILTSHLRDTRTSDQRETDHPADPRCWEGLHIDLTGATLMNFEFGNCHTAQARFEGATFTGRAVFIKATFTGDVVFVGATFTGNVWFNKATFTRDAWFERATFNGEAAFHGATFTRDATFGRATFTRYATFEKATFNGEAAFDMATFARDATFDWATFTEKATFHGATFARDATFDWATFTEKATFHGATFKEDATFAKVTFTKEVVFLGATFTRDAWFGEVTFTKKVTFLGATFKGDATFAEATFTKEAEFHGATFKGDATFEKATFVEAVFDRATFSQPPVWPEGWRLEAADEETARLVLVKSGEPGQGTPSQPSLGKNPLFSDERYDDLPS